MRIYIFSDDTFVFPSEVIPFHAMFAGQLFQYLFEHNGFLTEC